FEAHFLASPRRRERVAFVRDLITAVSRVAAQKPATPQRPVWQRWELAAAAALVVAALIASLQKAPRQGPKIASARPATEVTPAPVAAPSPQPQNTPSPPSQGPRPGGRPPPHPHNPPPPRGGGPPAAPSRRGPIPRPSWPCAPYACRRRRRPSRWRSTSRPGRRSCASRSPRLQRDLPATTRWCA